ncbi:MAG: YidC/Oxa1 family membrane protein insertase [Bacteroides sp.]|nr:YidC/Oxa1 family membrane protein insertase [Bacteroides sp.]MCM1549706.1 YidC/Oxa1 family membrane protein insertase [Clostridium sp.]
MIFLTAQGGFLGPFCWLLGKILDLIYEGLSAVGINNLALCIIIFTVVVKLILLPFTIRQQRGSKINQFIQPEIQKVQKKYKNRTDQESMLKQQQEIQEVYRKYGTSMTNGCLLSFIQLPIIYALYRVIYNIPAYVPAIKDLYTPIAQQVLKIKDYAGTISTFVTDNKISTASRAVTTLTKQLDAGNSITDNHIIDIISQFSMTQWESFGELFSENKDLIQAIAVNVPKINDLNQFILGINISEAPGWKLSWALIIPITAALFQFLSTKTMQTAQPDMGGDQAAAQSAAMMKTMTFTMPIMSLFICISLPAGIGLYWSISALISLLIQLAINVYYDKLADMDKILEKQMEKAKKKKRKNKKSFMERMMEAAGGAEAANTSSNSVAGTNLKSYNNTSSNNNSNGSATYRKGSIASKANIMQQYNNQKSKEE